MKFRLGELFCGPGGLAYGAKISKVFKDSEEYYIEHAWANDYDKDSCQTYINNISPDNPNSVFCEDIRKINIKSFNNIDAFAYGFPCNDYSIVGNQQGINGNYGPLYLYGIQVLNFFKPKFFIAENVGGLSSANQGKTFDRILQDLENAGNGYDLTVHLYKSENYGIPQKRHRIIIVGIDKIYGLKFLVPHPTTIEKSVSVKEAIESPPIPSNCANNEIPKSSKIVTERLNYILPGQNVWNANLPKHLQLNVKGAKLSQIYKRLDPSQPSYTITGSGGGGTHVYHWNEPRPLTNRERARLQSFPDDFVFYGNYSSVRKQIGMAVPPKLSEIIFTHILKTFAGIPYKYIKPSFVLKNDYQLKLA